MLSVNKKSTQVKVLDLLLEMDPLNSILTKNQWTLINKRRNLIWLDGQPHGDVNKRNLRLPVNVRWKDIRKPRNLEVFLVFAPKQILEKQEVNTLMVIKQSGKINQSKRKSRNNLVVDRNNKLLNHTKVVKEDDSWYFY